MRAGQVRNRRSQVPALFAFDANDSRSQNFVWVIRPAAIWSHGLCTALPLGVPNALRLSQVVSATRPCWATH